MKLGSKYTLAFLGLINLLLLLLWFNKKKSDFDLKSDLQNLYQVNAEFLRDVLNTEFSTSCDRMGEPNGIFKYCNELSKNSLEMLDELDTQQTIDLSKFKTHLIFDSTAASKYISSRHIYEIFARDSPWRSKGLQSMNAEQSKLLGLHLLKTYSYQNKAIHSLYDCGGGGDFSAMVDNLHSTYKVGDTLKANIFIGVRLNDCRYKSLIKSIEVQGNMYTPHKDEAFQTEFEIKGNGRVVVPVKVVFSNLNADMIVRKKYIVEIPIAD